jgi:hypothetical protein
MATPHTDGRKYRRPGAKQVALFCHLSRIIWKLSCRIEWGRLGRDDYGKVDAVRAMLSRAEAKARLARVREGGE